MISPAMTGAATWPALTIAGNSPAIAGASTGNLAGAPADTLAGACRRVFGCSVADDSTLPGRPEDARLRARVLNRYPAFIRARLEQGYRDAYFAPAPPPRPGDLSQIGRANQWLLQTDRLIRPSRPNVAFDEWELKQRARLYAGWCSSYSDERAIAFAKGRGVNLRLENGRLRAMRWRLSSAKWWMRQLRTLLVRDCEDKFRAAGFVHRFADCYISNDGLARRRQQRRAHADFIKATGLLNEETGELLPLESIARGSLANPAVRRAELMVRVKGFQDIAIRRGHCALFLTLTAPSAFHARLYNGQPNERYREDTPRVRDGQEWLCRMWSRTRAQLARQGVLYYGFRVAEPHHDGTPHWHALLFADPTHATALRQAIEKHWLSEYSDEPGASEARTKCVEIDLNRLGPDGRPSGAVGYIAKYIAKGIDGFALADDDPQETDLPGKEAAERVEAWARVHGIRQFQQIGGPSVTLYREFRRLRQPLAEDEVEAVRAPADVGDYAGFIDALGGIEVGRQSCFRIVTEADTHPDRWALIEQARETADLPEKAPRIVGIRALLRVGARIFTTRPAEWVRVLLAFASSPTWTRVNNCTDSPAAGVAHSTRSQFPEWVAMPEGARPEALRARQRGVLLGSDRI